METVDPRDLIAGGIFRESDFRTAVKAFDWTKFRDKPVLIQGCGTKTLPTWVFLVVTAELAPYAKSISYGEIARPIPVYGKLGGGTPVT